MIKTFILVLERHGKAVGVVNLTFSKHSLQMNLPNACVLNWSD